MSGAPKRERDGSGGDDGSGPAGGGGGGGDGGAGGGGGAVFVERAVVAELFNGLNAKLRELADGIAAAARRLGVADESALPLAPAALALSAPAPSRERAPPAPSAPASLLGLPDDVLERSILPFLHFSDGFVLSNVCAALRAHVKRVPWVDAETEIEIRSVRKWRSAFPHATVATIVGRHDYCFRTDFGGICHDLCGSDLPDAATICLRGMRALKLAVCRRLSAAGFSNFGSLQELTLRDCNYIGGEISHAQGLELLDIGESKFSDELMRGIARLPRLRVLHLCTKKFGGIYHLSEHVFEALNATHAHLRILKLVGVGGLDEATFSTPVFSGGGLIELSLGANSIGNGPPDLFLPAFTDAVLARQQQLVSLHLSCTFPNSLAPFAAAAADALPRLSKLNTFNLTTLVAADEFPLHGDRLTLTHTDIWPD